MRNIIITSEEEEKRKKVEGGVHQIQFTRSLQTGERVYRIRISVEARPWFVAVCGCCVYFYRNNANKHERERANDVSSPFFRGEG